MHYGPAMCRGGALRPTVSHSCYRSHSSALRVLRTYIHLPSPSRLSLSLSHCLALSFSLSHFLSLSLSRYLPIIRA